MSVGLYLHYPFCLARCAYCDAYKEIFDKSLEQRYFEALTIETDLVAADTADSIGRIDTIYIGGGTPSLVNLELFSDWLNQVKRRFDLADQIEFSLEMNPESVTSELMAELRGLGVTRPVFGIQSFNPDLLKLLDRRHNVRDSHQAVYLANALGFPGFGLDLIFGLPGQTSKMLASDLDQILELEPEHISFYELTIEPGTALAEKVARGSLKLPDDDFLYAQYRAGCDEMAEAGYTRYELSSFAREGHECRHNLGYWQGDNYIGLGVSAHSFVNNRRWANKPDLKDYINDLKQGRPPIVIDESGTEERITEAIMLGLRLSHGIDRTRFAERFGTALDACIKRDQYDALIESGHLIDEQDRLRLSDDGFHLAEEIVARLLP